MWKRISDLWFIGNYPNGFIVKNEKLDFDRGVYLEQYRGSEFYRLMSGVANTQMFEQVKQKWRERKTNFRLILVLEISNLFTTGKRIGYWWIWYWSKECSTIKKSEA